jgi:hypothetical protein
MKIKKIIFFCFELKILFSFALMKTIRIYNWSWRSSTIDAVNQAIL